MPEVPKDKLPVETSPAKCYHEAMTVMESILKDLETLPASKLVEVAHYVSRFNPKRRVERVAALKETAGCMAGEEGEAFEKAVAEEADRIDADTWK